VREKLRMMEELWEDLSRDPDNIKSPDWHRQALKEREARIASGQSKFIDWEKAKKEIRRRIA
jgi:Putative addiction module component